MNENAPMPLAAASQDNEIILYQPDSTIKLEVRLENETVWLTQQQMSELFERDRTVITRHINNIFKENELDEKRGCIKIKTLVHPYLTRSLRIER